MSDDYQCRPRASKRIGDDNWCAKAGYIGSLIQLKVGWIQISCSRTFFVTLVSMFCKGSTSQTMNQLFVFSTWFWTVPHVLAAVNLWSRSLFVVFPFSSNGKFASANNGDREEFHLWRMLGVVWPKELSLWDCTAFDPCTFLEEGM